MFLIICTCLNSVFIGQNNSIIELTENEKAEILNGYSQEKLDLEKWLLDEIEYLPEETIIDVEIKIALYEFYISSNTISFEYYSENLTSVASVILPVQQICTDNPASSTKLFVATGVFSLVLILFIIFFTEQVFLSDYRNNVIKMVLSTQINRKKIFTGKFYLWTLGVAISFILISIFIMSINILNNKLSVVLYYNNQWQSYSIPKLIWGKILSFYINSVLISSIVVFIGTWLKKSTYPSVLMLCLYAFSLYTDSMSGGATINNINILMFNPLTSASQFIIFNQWQTYASWGITLIVAISIFFNSKKIFMRQDI